MNILIVIESSGQYDDYRSDPILATFDQAKADAKVAEMNARFTRRGEVYQLLADHMKQWEASNPRPQNKPPKLRNLPSYPGNFNKWTKQQQGEYRAVKAHNYQMSIDSAKDLGEWIRATHEERLVSAATFTQQEQDDLANMDSDSGWSIDEIPFEE